MIIPINVSIFPTIVQFEQNHAVKIELPHVDIIVLMSTNLIKGVPQKSFSFSRLTTTTCKYLYARFILSCFPVSSIFSLSISQIFPLLFTTNSRIFSLLFSSSLSLSMNGIYSLLLLLWSAAYGFVNVVVVVVVFIYFQ